MPGKQSNKADQPISYQHHRRCVKDFLVNVKLDHAIHCTSLLSPNTLNALIPPSLKCLHWIALPFLCKLHIHAPSPWPIFHAGKWPTGRVESSKSLANQEWSETQMLFQPPQFINCYLLQPVTPSVMLQFTMLLAFVAKLVSESLTLTNQPATLLQNHIGEAPNPA